MRKKRSREAYEGITVTLAGNPNVGKSTLFNTLTGMRAHTGNWAGKTVACESATRKYENYYLHFVDIPGTYSLFSHSEEEKIARDYICFGGADLTLIVCDATSLMQNLNLVLQITETQRRCVLCLNFISEAERKGIRVNTERLSELLNIPVIPIEAHGKRDAMRILSYIAEHKDGEYPSPIAPTYPEPIERALEIICASMPERYIKNRLARWLSLRLLDAEGDFLIELTEDFTDSERAMLLSAKADASGLLLGLGISESEIGDIIVESIVSAAEQISREVTVTEKKKSKDWKIDRILTGRALAYPTMLLLVLLVFWITLSLANYPSELLSEMFGFIELKLTELFIFLNFPEALRDALLSGVFRTLGQVVSVMLPPMVIFFPLFALLEDSGYLPRVAYNLDRPFACAGACGKQALTMCMGFGCNAVGIVGARIIDSERERRLAILTNSLVPCNGRLPMMITLITVFCLFFIDSVPTLLIAFILLGFIMLSVAMTLLSTAFLSRALFKGRRSSFTIELVPYRRPRFFSVIIHSLRDKCASVLMRAVLVSAPMGLLIWIFANTFVGEVSIISHISQFLDPLGRLMGLDGVILLAFILGIPANEIVIPLMLMIYSAEGAIGAEIGVGAMRELFISAGWSSITALSALVFSLFHFPCSTSLLTVYKETKSKKMLLIAFLLPTVIGFLLCVLISLFGRIFL